MDGRWCAAGRAGRAAGRWSACRGHLRRRPVCQPDRIERGDALGRHLGALGAREVAYVRLAAGRKAGLDDYLAVVPVDQRAEVFDRLVTSAGGIGRAPARDRHTTVPEPEDDEVDRFDDVPEEAGHQVLDDIARFLRRFVAFTSPAQAERRGPVRGPHSRHRGRRSASPGGAVTEKRSGKTRLLELLELLTRRGQLTASVSSAALFRLLEAHQPTFLIDEADTIFARTRNGDPRNEDLRGIVNAGHRRGAVVIRCVGEGAAITTKAFRVFGPVALAGIGQLPDTIHDRSVVIALRRRRSDDASTSFVVVSTNRRR